MDYDVGRAAREITLTSRKANGLSDKLILRCHWIEYVHVWHDDRPSHFLVSLDDTCRLTDHDWQLMMFHDGSGKLHRYVVKDATTVGPLKVLLTKVR
jgi:hypothetical protein